MKAHWIIFNDFNLVETTNLVETSNLVEMSKNDWKTTSFFMFFWLFFTFSRFLQIFHHYYYFTSLWEVNVSIIIEFICKSNNWIPSFSLICNHTLSFYYFYEKSLFYHLINSMTSTFSFIIPKIHLNYIFHLFSHWKS